MSEALFESHPGRLRVPPDKAGKSKITNGSAFLPGIDGRSPWVRRCKDVIADHLVDLGGYDRCSAAERSCRSFGRVGAPGSQVCRCLAEIGTMQPRREGGGSTLANPRRRNAPCSTNMTHYKP
jgi:hypothetical protein